MWYYCFVYMENRKDLNFKIPTETFLKIGFFALLFFALYKLYNIVLIVLLAIVIASFVESAVKKMKPYIKNRTLSVFLVYVVAISLIIGLSSVFMPVFVSEMSELVSSLSQYIPKGSVLNTFQSDTIVGTKHVFSNLSKNASISDVVSSFKNLIDSMSGGFVDVFGGAFMGVVNFGLVMIISFYLSITEKGVENFLRIITPKEKEEYVIGLWERTERKIGLWLQGQMLLGVIIGVLAYLGLTILGVKYSLFLAILTALFMLVPYGIFIAVIPVVLFSIIDGGITLAFISFLLYFILHQFETYLIYPLIIKKVIGVSPLVVILSLIVGLQLAGFAGMILAIPFAVCLLEFLDDLEKKKIEEK